MAERFQEGMAPHVEARGRLNEQIASLRESGKVRTQRHSTGLPLFNVKDILCYHVGKTTESAVKNWFSNVRKRPNVTNDGNFLENSPLLFMKLGPTDDGYYTIDEDGWIEVLVSANYSLAILAGKGAIASKVRGNSKVDQASDAMMRDMSARSAVRQGYTRADEVANQEFLKRYAALSGGQQLPTVTAMDIVNSIPEEKRIEMVAKVTQSICEVSKFYL